MFLALWGPPSSSWGPPSGGPEATSAGWRDAPEYVHLFAPRSARGAYRAAVSPLPLDAVLRVLERDPALLRPPGAWQPKAIAPLDAFGGPGATDRWALARLYGSRAPLIARGPRADGERVVESWTLISPYPNPSLERLEPGTLAIVVRLP